jgi:hypothetical protein
MRKKLEYAFDLYDIQRNKFLEVNKIKEIIFGIIELFNPVV